MMKTAQYTAEYLAGISEGRELLKLDPNLTDCALEMRIEQLRGLIRSASKPVGDLYRGERDFWKHQLAIYPPTPTP